MNEKMWSHPATVESIAKLKSWNVRILEPTSGHQACGDTGVGRMLEPEIIFSVINSYFASGEITV
jgi:phosphopantothenoylcysteine decarboxylase/phosphopantothenate--cysteine ligase